MFIDLSKYAGKKLWINTNQIKICSVRKVEAAKKGIIDKTRWVVDLVMGKDMSVTIKGDWKTEAEAAEILRDKVLDY